MVFGLLLFSLIRPFFYYTAPWFWWVDILFRATVLLLGFCCVALLYCNNSIQSLFLATTAKEPRRCAAAPLRSWREIKRCQGIKKIELFASLCSFASLREIKLPREQSVQECE